MNTQKMDEADVGHICDLCGIWNSNLERGACEECIEKYDIREVDNGRVINQRGSRRIITGVE